MTFFFNIISIKLYRPFYSQIKLFNMLTSFYKITIDQLLYKKTSIWIRIHMPIMNWYFDIKFDLKTGYFLFHWSVNGYIWVMQIIIYCGTGLLYYFFTHMIIKLSTWRFIISCIINMSWYAFQLLYTPIYSEQSLQILIKVIITHIVYFFMATINYFPHFVSKLPWYIHYTKVIVTHTILFIITGFTLSFVFFFTWIGNYFIGLFKEIESLIDTYLSVTDIKYSVEPIPILFMISDTNSIIDSDNSNNQSRLKEYWKNRGNLVNEKDVGQTTDNPYILVARYMRGEGELNLTLMNSVLARLNIVLTAEDFSMLENLVPTVLPFPLPKFDRDVISTIGTNDTKVQGCYVFTHIIDGQQYVGRSNSLANRIREYNKKKLGLSQRPIAQLMNTNGFEAFGLHVYTLTSSVTDVTSTSIKDLTVGLEQYLVLKYKPTLNSIHVVDGVNINTTITRHHGHNNVPLFVYNEDNTLLLYKSISTQALLKDLGLFEKQVSNSIKNGTPIFDKFYVDNKLLDGVTVSLQDKETLAKDIKTISKTFGGRSTRNAVVVTDLLTKEQHVFKSKKALCRYTQENTTRPLYMRNLSKIPVIHNNWHVDFE